MDRAELVPHRDRLPLAVIGVRDSIGRAGRVGIGHRAEQVAGRDLRFQFDFRPLDRSTLLQWVVMGEAWGGNLSQPLSTCQDNSSDPLLSLIVPSSNAPLKLPDTFSSLDPLLSRAEQVAGRDLRFQFDFRPLDRSTLLQWVVMGEAWGGNLSQPLSTCQDNSSDPLLSPTCQDNSSDPLLPPGRDRGNRTDRRT